jgi:hypothetical protein
MKQGATGSSRSSIRRVAGDLKIVQAEANIFL